MPLDRSVDAAALGRAQSAEPELAVELCRPGDATVLAEERVLRADLADARAEAWFATVLRRGRPGVPLDQLEFALRPRLRSGSTTHCEGFALDVTLPDGTRRPALFARDSVATVAERAARRLVDEGQLTEPALSWDLRIASPAGGAAPDPRRDGLDGGELRVALLDPSTVELAELLSRARIVEVPGNEPGVSDLQHTVVYTQAALEKAELVARRGAAETPPVETGGVLVGPLCSCPATGEFFLVVCDVVEATEVESTTTSLGFSATTWSRIEGAMRVRREQEPTRNHRIIGHVHGHPFLPAGGPPCAACRPGSCTRVSAFLSAEDEQFTRALFVDQPWCIAHVFGSNARGEGVDRLFGVAGGRLRPRPYHVVPGFTPAFAS